MDWRDKLNTIIQGDVRERLKEVPSGKVDMIITSPPFWGLRTYPGEPQIWGGDEKCEHSWGEDSANIKRSGGAGYMQDSNTSSWFEYKSQFCANCSAWRGELGLEPHPSMFIDHIVAICRELRRVLKDTGSMWLNMGDSYFGGGRGKDEKYGEGRDYCPINFTGSVKKSNWLQPKQLMLMPSRIAIALQDDGWICRNDVVWHKINPMPSSTKDRLNNCYEHLYFCVKSNTPKFWTNNRMAKLVTKQPLGIKGIEGIDWRWKRGKLIINILGFLCYPYGFYSFKKVTLWRAHDYYFDLDAIRCEPEHKGHYRKDGTAGSVDSETKFTDNIYNPGFRVKYDNPSGKNPGDVFTLSTQPFPEAHFATYPEALIEKPILACCPERVCDKCGEARVRVSDIDRKLEPGRKVLGIGKKTIQATENSTIHHIVTHTTIGFTICACDNPTYSGGVVLDPFMGSGTTAIVCIKNNRQFIGIDLSQDYIDKIAIPRLNSIEGVQTVKYYKSTNKQRELFR